MKIEPRHRFGLKAAFLLLLCVAFIGSAEGILRIFDYHYRPLKITFQNLGDTDWRGFHAFQDRHFVYDPQLIWRPVKEKPAFNKQGFRRRELSNVPEAHIIQIVALGDSNTLGPEDRPGWPEYLQQLYERSALDIAVINAGVSGYSSFQGLRLFQDILQYEPQMVLVSFGANDAHHVLLSDEDYLNRVSVISSWCKHFRLCELLVATRDQIYLRRKILEPTSSWTRATSTTQDTGRWLK